ncbi:MAG: DUF4270 domain-containing protein [Muribaculaceae bacterium]|nr:DUF4270 domain-containing protein [Muribaculaceae bacterium]MDE6351784.1 DUF4270 domain-containing protein [Muribaculaceae bacterium]MDE7092231.1 DUF4270 domain-containing protein [Muribaculaceae bacterium]
MKHLRFLTALILPAILFIACENTTNIGPSLVGDQMQIIVDSTFVITGKSVENKRIQSRTITQILGSITAKEYGSLSSDFVTQFMPAATIDTTNVQVENIDSLRLIFRIPETDIIGDSLVPMGLSIYPLNKALPSPIYSDFDPEGYYDPNDLISSSIYKCNTLAVTDTSKVTGQKYIFVSLPKTLAQKLYSLYVDNPANYSNPQNFCKVFPGFYVSNSYGSGRVVRIAQSVMRLHYHKNFVNSNGNDTTVNYVGYYYGVQPEVISNNVIKYSMSESLKQKVEDGQNIIVAPAGRDIEIEFPATKIIETYKSQAGNMSVVNTLTFSIPVESVQNNYNISIPQTMLMILSRDKDKFFIDNKVTDDVTSFFATYNSTTKSYDFSEMRAYMMDLLKKESITPEDYTFTLTPITLETTTNASTSYYYYGTTTETVNAIVPYTGTPTMANLLLDKSKIVLTFSKQNSNY